MTIMARIKENTASVRLLNMMLRINDTGKLFKTWGTVVLNKARANARAKGGRTLWKSIADYTRLTSVSSRGAVVECLSYIGAHKEHGGPIRAKYAKFLTIPINEAAKGKRAAELELSGIKLFRIPGQRGGGILAASDDNGGITPYYALVKETRPQKKDKWWPPHRWVLDAGVNEARWHIEKGH